MQRHRSRDLDTITISEYSNVNGLLRNLHLCRSNHIPAAPPSGQLHDTSGTTKIKTREIFHAKQVSITGLKETMEVGHAERDAVTRAYEEVNQ
jgi:hypothetical protein